MDLKDRRSPRITFFCFIALGLFLGMMMFIAGCTTESPPRFCMSRFSYDLNIHTSEPITNATFYLPLPVKNGTPMIGTLQLNRSHFEKNNFSIDFIQSPPGINLTGTYPVQNEIPWFIKISANEIFPDKTKDAEYDIDIDYSTDDLDTRFIFLNTLYPLGNESVFLPKRVFSPLPPTRITSHSPEWIEYAPVNVPQKL